MAATRRRSQQSSRRTWPSCTSHWRPSWWGRRSSGQPRIAGPMRGHVSILQLGLSQGPPGDPLGCPPGPSWLPPGLPEGGASPRLEFQGSDGYLKKQWRLIAKGELGYIPAKHIVSALPEEGERPSSTHKKIMDGWDREDEEEARSHPTSRRQLERLHQTFRTTLLMCTAALPQFGNLKVTKAELDDWYDWFYGEDIAGRRPPLSDTTLLFAERNAWRKIHEMVHQATTLSDALKNIRGDFLFWQREVYEHLNRAPEKGKNKGKAPKVWQTQWEKPKKGGKGTWPSGPTRSKPKGKGGKGKSPNSGSMAGPLGFQESQRGGVLQRSSPPQQVFGIVRPFPQLPGQEGWVGV